jgi:MoaA/NifB/PqqE/SkfB family radical SAM enzyme
VTCNVWKNASFDELNTEEMKNAMHQLKDVGVKTLIFVGGEPLLRSDVGSIIGEASSLGFENIIVVTNGLLLEQKAEELLDAGVTHIDVSIDAVGESNDRIRGVPGYYERAVAGIRAVQRLKKSKGLDVAVTIMTTLLMNDNVDDIPGLVEVARSLDAFLLFNLLGNDTDISKGIPLSELLVNDEGKIDETIDFLKMVNKKYPGLISQCDYTLEYARNYLKGKNRYDFHCVHGYQMVYVGSHGEIYPSCWAMEPIGNVRVDKLSGVVG